MGQEERNPEEAAARELWVKNVLEFVQQEMKSAKHHDFLERGLHVFSDVHLEEGDAVFLKKIWAELNGKTKRTIGWFLLNQGHWEAYQKHTGRREPIRAFGWSESFPDVTSGREVFPFTVLPSEDALQEGMPLRRLLEFFAPMRRELGREGKRKEFYQALCLRFLTAYEAARLSSSYEKGLGEIQDAPDLEQQRQGQSFADTRDFLACVYGLFHLRKNNKDVYDTFIQACHAAGENDWSVETDQTQYMAQQVTDAAKILYAAESNHFSEKEWGTVFSSWFQQCRSLDKDERNDLIADVQRLRKGGELEKKK
ncbi:MAG TPA: hypothetical protein VJB99_00510 [Patescibacteria group bacterium]|nr:hypothetical protein [Patescibacteria group bacterium]